MGTQIWEQAMKSGAVTKVGIREFRTHLPKYILTSSPVAITRHGETVGYYIPTRHHAEQPELDALIQAAKTLEKLLASHGITEDQLLTEFRGLREKTRNKTSLDEERGKLQNLKNGL